MIRKSRSSIRKFNRNLLANVFDDGKVGLQKIGENVWGGIQGGKQKLSDYTDAIALSIQYIPRAISQRVDAVLQEALIGFVIGLVGAAGVVSVTTALGAAIGSFVGGVGAAPGAVVGLKVGMMLLEWMGLLFLANWLASRMGGIAIAFGDFLTTVWNANGNYEAIDKLISCTWK